MLRSFITSFIVLALVSFTLPVDLEVRSLLDDKIEIKIPKDFTVMEKELLEKKYPGANRPKLVYTNERGTINVAFTHTKAEVVPEDLESFVAMMKKTLETVHEDAEFLSDGVKQVNGRKVGYIELVTQAIDTKVYNLMFFTDVDGRLLICSFNCTQKHIEEWKSVGAEIMSSLKVK